MDGTLRASYENNSFIVFYLNPFFLVLFPYSHEHLKHKDRARRRIGFDMRSNFHKIQPQLL